MTLQEILKANGLSDEDVQSVIGEMKKNKIFTASEENLDIRYGKLKGDFDALTSQHSESAKLIETLKAGTKDSEAMQTKIADYESQIDALNKQLKETQLESAIKIALQEAKATDIDYMAFKLKEKGELELDDNGSIKGIADKLAGLKTQFPAHFEAGNAGQRINENLLPNGGNSQAQPKSLAEALEMQCEEN